MPNFADKEAQAAIMTILKNGPMAAGEIAKLTGHTTPTVTGRLQAMAYDGLVKITRQPGTKPSLWSLVNTVTNATPPRTYQNKQPFKGVDWSTSIMRPGCQDHLQHPSRRSDGLHPYREPILNASSSMARAGEK